MDIEERFWSKVRLHPTDCWEWKASCWKNGYGQFGIKGRMRSAHRVSYELSVGNLGNMNVCHTCDNRKCVRPSHLFLGTQKENIRDMYAKGKGKHQRAQGIRQRSAKLTEEQVLTIRNSKVPNRAIAKEYGVDKATILKIKKGLTWTHVRG